MFTACDWCSTMARTTQSIPNDFHSVVFTVIDPLSRLHRAYIQREDLDMRTTYTRPGRATEHLVLCSKSDTRKDTEPPGLHHHKRDTYLSYGDRYLKVHSRKVHKQRCPTASKSAHKLASTLPLVTWSGPARSRSTFRTVVQVVH
jgi:hypothetical protein